MVAQCGGCRLVELWMESTDRQAADLIGPGDTELWMVSLREVAFWDLPRCLSLSSVILQGYFLCWNTLPPAWVSPGPSTVPSILESKNSAEMNE